MDFTVQTHLCQKLNIQTKAKVNKTERCFYLAVPRVYVQYNSQGLLLPIRYSQANRSAYKNKAEKNKVGYRILAYIVFTGHLIILQVIAICIYFAKVILDMVIFRFKSAFYSPKPNAVV